MIRTIVAAVGVLGFVLGGTTAIATSVSVHDAPGTIELTGVGCETASTCVAVGAGPTSPTDGTVVTVTNGVPGAATAVAATGSLLAVTCWSTTRCVAVGPSPSGAAGVVLPITNGVPGTAVQIPASSLLLGVACLPSPSTTCYAVGTSASRTRGIVLEIKNGVPGATTLVRGSFELDMIACPGSSTCLAAGGTAPGHGVIVTLGDGKPVGVSNVPSSGELGGIGCTSDSTCYVVGGKYNTTTSEVITVSGGIATTIRGFAAGSLAHIVCVFGGKCLASGYTFNGPPEGLEATITNGKPGKPVLVSGTENLLRGACLSSGMCEVGGETTHVTIGLVADSPV
jgi:hypothetical protein